MKDLIEGICSNCNKRQATISWVGDGSTMDYIHGNYQRWCDYCSIKAQLTHAKKQAKKIPILERKLARLK